MCLKGERCKSDKCPINKKRAAPGKDPKGRTGKRSEYGLQLREKQKIKRMYGVQEKQFHLTFEHALRMPGVTGENLIRLLESRLDNIVYRMHIGSCRKSMLESKVELLCQIVLHRHVMVNGRIVNIPSFQVKPGDVIEVKERSKKLAVIQDSLKEVSKSGTAPWITLDG